MFSVKLKAEKMKSMLNLVKILDKIIKMKEIVTMKSKDF